MSAIFPNGTVFSVSTGLAAALAMTAVTNANPAVASVASPPTDGSILVVKSGWSELNERVVRAENADVGTIELGGINTTSTSRFPAGQGAGQLIPVSTWVDLSQVTNIEKTGGEQQFYQWRYVEDRSSRQRQRPTFKNAKFITLTLDYDPALAWYEALKEADAVKDTVVLRAKLPNGDELYYLVYPSFDADPSMQLDVNMQNTATFSMTSDFTRYAPMVP
ncbi:phage tail protein [Bordetella bronchiseptica]|uniref:phage tail protein n=1 Tax=Bordetella bronchiseptica TaxID=518 RepID=UPI003EDCAE13